MKKDGGPEVKYACDEHCGPGDLVQPGCKACGFVMAETIRSLNVERIEWRNANSRLASELIDSKNTMRDTFASSALAGYLAYSPSMSAGNPKARTAAELAYGYADAMLEARDK